MTNTQRSTHYIASRSTDDYTGYRMVPLASREQANELPRIRAAWEIAGVRNFDDAMGALLASLGGKYVGSDTTITRIVPREPDADERLDAARGVLRADYWQDVANVISWLRHEISNGSITDTDAATQHIDETVDGHQRVIYTGQAIECLLFSLNEDAYQDETGDSPDMSDGSHWSQLAYYAFRADIMAEIGDLDAFVDDNRPKPFAECDDCGDDIETEADAHIVTDEDVTVCADCAEAREDAKKLTCDACGKEITDEKLYANNAGQRFHIACHETDA